MKSLFLLRHAKADVARIGQKDIDRPLNQHGRQAARAMGEYLAKSGLLPQHVLCSSARRTQETLHQIRLILTAGARIDICEELYLVEPAQIISLVSGINFSTDRLMIIGHNPGLETLVGTFSIGAGNAATGRVFKEFATGALAVFTIDIEDWRDIAAGSARLELLVQPRDLAQPV